VLTYEPYALADRMLAPYGLKVDQDVARRADADSPFRSVVDVTFLGAEGPYASDTLVHAAYSFRWFDVVGAVFDAVRTAEIRGAELAGLVVVTAGGRFRVTEAVDG